MKSSITNPWHIWELKRNPSLHFDFLEPQNDNERFWQYIQTNVHTDLYSGSLLKYHVELQYPVIGCWNLHW